nr:RNA-directed DNA polymerase, eukaryota [Tanacetum cinerariifolium]
MFKVLATSRLKRANVHDTYPIQHPGFSMLERLEETIKIGLALGLNMEGCETTLASLITDKGYEKSKLVHVDLWMLCQIWGNVHFDFASTSARGMFGVVMGNFNIVFNERERYGSVFCDRQVGIFNEFITDNSVLDVPLGGLVLEKGIPDHRPILLKEYITWRNDGLTDANGFILFKKKLQNLKKVIRLRISSRRSNTYAIKKEHQNKLSLIDSKIDQGSATNEDFINRRDSLAILGNIDRLEAKDYAQKAKIKWVLEGDENTNFFHATLKKKRRQLAIRGILKNGDWIDAPDKVKDEFLLHFSNRFKQPNGPPSTIESLSFNSISQSQSDYLELPFSRNEIKKTVWDCGGDSAPGPDGFTFRFFTTFWDTIEADVVRFVQEFSHSHVIPNGCNPSFIALIPKVFIKGRYILDGPLILNEILAEYRYHNKELFVFKLDFEKAFDSLRWDFLDAAMDKIGFGSKWQSWILGCLKNARSSILFNGSPTKEFELFRGLRQGDPLSPFFFILAMEGLHSLTCKEKELGLFKGLKINVDKSNVLGVGVSDEEVSHMANIIGCGASKFPFKYLGVLVECNMNRCVNWNVVIQKFSTKLSSWKARLLSVGGRLSFIKAVLDQNDNKMSWVKWERSLAYKKKGGLGIGNIFGLNIGLLFKWIWHFLTRPPDLWARVIGSIYGHDEGTALCTRKLGNGESTRFWEDIWCGTNPLRLQFPRIYLLETDMNCLIANRVSLLPFDWSSVLRRRPIGGVESSQFDALNAVIGNVILTENYNSWQWLLDVAVGYSVASTCTLVDDSILETDLVATRWNRNIPIKVNVFLLRLNLNKLPSRVNLERKGVEISSILCPSCHLDVETVNHIFFNCELAKDLWSLLNKWWEVDILVCANSSDWYDLLDDVRIPAKACSILEGTGGLSCGIFGASEIT